MLSLLIPTYNFDCLLLIQELHEQCEALRAVDGEFDYEIVVADDCSPRKDLVHALQETTELLGERVRLMALPKNVGRAAVRNRLLSEARGAWVVLMDSDARVVHDDFVKKYWEVRNRMEVVAGGILHPSTIERGYELRIVYERSFEKERRVEWRQKHPYAHFSVFNLMARKDVITKFCFDLRCEEYGYEDFFLGVALEAAGVPVSHIDNPLLHTGIDTSEVFLGKAETAVRTLSRLPQELRNKTGLEAHASRLRRLRLDGLFTTAFSGVQSAVRGQLLSKRPSVLLLQLYKLFVYLKCRQAK
ncbi:MAG: glycosyltransferase family 2 protein [Bacteroidaceae bacterium]|nr:glycosyltransferase family 2 protein [Bacteroidaceae bacterium]